VRTDTGLGFMQVASAEAELARLDAAISEQEDVIARLGAAGGNAAFAEVFPEQSDAAARSPMLHAPRVRGTLVRCDWTRDSFEVVTTL